MSDTANPLAPPGAPELLRGLRLLDSIMLVMGSMIGSGIFLVSSDVARQVGSPGLLILAWVLTGIFTLACALSYAELAAALPHAGGQYVYLREAFGPWMGFLFGWTFFLVIQGGTIAAVAVAFAKYLGVLAPSVSATRYVANLGEFGLPFSSARFLAAISTQQLAAILSIAALTFLNCFGIRIGALVQNVFTITKTGALLGLVLLGIVVGSNAEAIAANFGSLGGSWGGSSWENFWGGAGWNLATLTILGVAMVGPIFAADAWNNVSFNGEEVENPRRTLPLSMMWGVGLVCLIYVAVNFVYLSVLPLQGSSEGIGLLERGIQYAEEDRVATAAAQVLVGSAGPGLMALAIVISTFGCNNGLILSGARVYYAMAKDKLFFSSVASVHPKYRTPVVSLLVQGVWASLLTLSGTYSQLLDYIIFAVLLFYILTLCGLFVLRVKRPQLERPYRAWGYPYVPALYILMAAFLEWNLLLHKPEYTWAGLGIVLSGVPVYFLWRRFSPSSEKR